MNSWMSPLSLMWLFLGIAGWAAPQWPGAARTNPCAVCHLRNASTQSAVTHVDEWVTSKHALYRVGCEKCHGGDARTSNQAAAHRGVIKSSDPSSPIHWMRLPATCGRCHRSEVSDFARSTHAELLSQGDAMAPTCTSCHGSMAADVLAPAALEKLCLSCHHDDRQDRARIARAELEDMIQLRDILRRTALQIAVVADPVRRALLQAQWKEADRSLRSATAGVHAFDDQIVRARLTDAHARADQLTSEFAKD